MTLKKLTNSQKKQLDKHKVHHSKKHMASMRMNMMRGDTKKNRMIKLKNQLGNKNKLLIKYFLKKNNIIN